MRKLRPSTAALGVAVLLAAACAPSPSRFDSPPRGGFVDGAGLVDAASAQRIEGLLAALLEEGEVELLVLVVPSLGGESPDRFAAHRLEAWRVGAEVGGRGALLVVAAAERLVRLEVGYALEPVLTDAFVGYLERDQMAPYFADGRVGAGVEATVELFVDRILAAASGAPASAPATPAGSFLGGGAGAETAVRFEGGNERPTVDLEARRRFAAQPTPLAAWEAFLETNRRHLKDSELGLYDEGARRRMRGTVSDAGQDHIAALYGERQPTVRQQGDRAVVLFPEDADHRLAPWFFRRSAEGWQLDGTAVYELVAYNHRNQWRLRTLDHPYVFAFDDLRFDAHGFAFPGQ